MNSLDQVRTDIDNILDTRKLQKLIDDGVTGHDDIATAPIVFVCNCGYEQDIDNDTCVICGKDIS